MSAAPIVDATATDEELSTRRMNVMRFGYAFLGVGVAIVKWPVLIQPAPSIPVMEGVVACLLTAVSLLAFLGLRYPVRMLPILLFEVTWKVVWIAAVAIPHLVSDDMNAKCTRCCSAVPSSSSSSPSSVAIHLQALRPDARRCLALMRNRCGPGRLSLTVLAWGNRRSPARGSVITRQKPARPLSTYTHHRASMGTFITVGRRQT